MAIEETKEKLHSLIEQTNNEVLLEDLLLEAKNRIYTTHPHEAEGLSIEDYDELLTLVNEPPEKDTISYDELKASLSRWFTKIVFKKRFRNKLEKLVIYIENDFGLLVAKKFMEQMEKKLFAIQQQPFVGKSSMYIQNVRSIHVGKYNRVYYKVQDDKITFLNIYDTRMNPKKTNYDKTRNIYYSTLRLCHDSD
ncbi:MAG: type II toxin-antitoxin system RelE/ParE family toxin [Nitrososphaeraceae archaeon]